MKEIRYAVPAVDRAIRIIRYLQKNKLAGVSEIAGALKITPSNCHAILKTLQSNNLLSFDPNSKKYELGLGLLEIGRTVARESSVIQIAKPIIRDYVKQSRLTTFLVQQMGSTRLIIVDREETADDVRLSITVGTRFPITHGATGKCFLAFLPVEESEGVLRQVGIRPVTPKTVVKLDEYRSDLAEIRRLGYAASYEESVEGTNAIAACSFDSEGRPVTVMTSLGYTSTLPSRKMAERGRLLREYANRLTLALGGQPPYSHR